MIRFCDKNVYTIGKGELSRSQMMSFYLSENGAHRKDVLLVMEEDCYYGIVTFQRLLKGLNVEECILRETVNASENLFEEAEKLFQKYPGELLPILDTKKQLCGFCYNDKNGGYQFLFSWLSLLSKAAEEFSCSFFDYKKDCKQICIMECNELAYRCYCLFRNLGCPIRVEGAEWEWFGISQSENFSLRNETFYIYAEGAEETRWSWTFDEEPPYIGNYFEFLYSWQTCIKKYIYAELIDNLKGAGVPVWCCLGPGTSKITYLTELELKSRCYQVNLTEALYAKKIEEEKRDILDAIMGPGEAEMYCDKKMETEEGGFKKISYTNISCEILNKEELGKRGRIYLIGPCIVGGVGNFTKNTLPARLQEWVKRWDYVVVRILFSDQNFCLFSKHEIKKIPFREKDIVCIIDQEKCLEGLKGCACLDLLPLYNRKERETWMIDECSIHLNKEGTAAIADEIYNKALEKEIKRILKSTRTNRFLQKGEILSDELQEKVREYIDKVRSRTFVRGGGIGSIVMNCNPFTYGHQYLIEYAASKVEWLYIFVVEEDRSVFPFVLRRKMVEEGVKHLGNVCVIPSGEWVLSYKTFPIYFGKTQRQEEKADAGIDLEIFARYIAPPLGITYRFVGEEPTDKVTRQYNEQMKRILGEFDICVEEVPRKEFNGNVISASYVRKCMEEKRFEEIVNYVPESTKILLGRV